MTAMQGAPRGESEADAALLSRRAGQQGGRRRPTSSRVARLARSTSLLRGGSRTCLYVHRPVMRSGGVVIDVPPAQFDSGRGAAEHNRQLREDHRRRQCARCWSAGRGPPGIAPLVAGADSLVFGSPPPELLSADVGPWSASWPRHRRIDASPASSASRRLCAAVSALRVALSRRNAFPSEPAPHNRTLSIEAGVAALFTSDVLSANSEFLAEQLCDRG